MFPHQTEEQHLGMLLVLGCEISLLCRAIIAVNWENFTVLTACSLSLTHTHTTWSVSHLGIVSFFAFSKLILLNPLIVFLPYCFTQYFSQYHIGLVPFPYIPIFCQCCHTSLCCVPGAMFPCGLLLLHITHLCCLFSYLGFFLFLHLSLLLIFSL